MLLLRGATSKIPPCQYSPIVSIHAPLARSNMDGTPELPDANGFNTCSSCEEQPGFHHFCLLIHDSFNTCSSCEEQLRDCPPTITRESFNTCSSCEEQLSRAVSGALSSSFNTCSSCEEQLDKAHDVFRVFKLFQYMLLLRGATTWNGVVASLTFVFQYMLLLRGATFLSYLPSSELQVSIHAPLARSNFFVLWCILTQKRFQYMLLLRGATSPSR